MCKFIYFISYWRVLQEKKIFARGHGVWLRRLAVTGLRRKFIAVRVVTLNYWSGRRLAPLKIDWTMYGSMEESTPAADRCGEGACASGYTYAGQFVFDKETLSSTYPDFDPICSAGPCGNTCCVPSNGTAQAMAGE